MDLCNLSVIRDLMSDAGITFRKEFGQNFLTNRMIPEDIADNCTDTAESMILEIGPGIGCLTQELALRFKKVVAVEIDKGLIPVLDKTLAEFDNVTVINADIMETDIQALVDQYSDGMPVSVCANLPYYITTPILMKLLESRLPFDYIPLMIQSEVADRLCALPGTPNYGSVTAYLNYFGTCKKLLKVPAGKFLPPPKVDSAVVRIDLYRDRPCKPKDEKIFFRTMRAAFEQRRKTLPNALAAGFGEISKADITDAIIACGFDANIRGERLSVAEFCALSDKLCELINNK